MRPIHVVALAALLVAAPAHADLKLMAKHGCNVCHAVDKLRVGPAYRDVAARYAGQPGALERLIESIRKGGTGKWGGEVMPPQDKVPEGDVRALAEWVLSGAK